MQHQSDCLTFNVGHATWLGDDQYPCDGLQELRKRQRSGEEAHQLQRIDSVRSQEEELSREEVIRRLRLLGQPITLFGEVMICNAV